MPFEMHLAFFVTGRPDLSGTDAVQNIDELLVQMIFRIERAAGWDLRDEHSGETFHSLEVDVYATAAGSLPWFSRQYSDILYTVTIDNRNTLFAQPRFVTGLSLEH